jgi:hypothetical protein
LRKWIVFAFCVLSLLGAGFVLLRSLLWAQDYFANGKAAAGKVFELPRYGQEGISLALRD